MRLASNTKVKKIGEVDRYYVIQTADCTTGYSYKGNFSETGEAFAACSTQPTGSVVTSGTVISKESLMARNDVLKIIVLDVEVGDATIIICPIENGKRDVLIIDTGENDSDRIEAELKKHGFELADKPVSRLYLTHYDFDHIGGSPDIIPIARIVYDHGDNQIKDYYAEAVGKPGVDRREMTLNYQEFFSGGVSVECVAVNQATDFNPTNPPHVNGDNENSIALIISYEGFDFFVAGDLTFSAERALATGVKNCDVYHANHHGSRTTSSDLDFVRRLDPEVTVASNGTKHGHPSDDVAQRLIGLGSVFYQTNNNEFDARAHNPNPKFVADDTNSDDSETEEEDGAVGNIYIMVPSTGGKYYVVMNGLTLTEATYTIEK